MPKGIYKRTPLSKEQKLKKANTIFSIINRPEIIDNGRTLCKECHITTETYGVRKK